MALRRVIRDAIVLAAAAIVLALAANALSPRGLSLTREYFPARSSGDSKPAGGAPQRRASGSEAASGGPVLDGSRFRVATHAQVEGWFNDPAYREQRILFIDARNADRFREGHIPGALPFDHFRPEGNVADVLGRAHLAEHVLVYCTGGSCEDSERVAEDLIALGVPENKLWVYAGGINEWTRRGLPTSR